MTELPEVETVANGVHERVRGQRIESVWLSFKPQTFKTPAAEMAAALDGRRIDQVRRVGKHIVFDLSDGAGDRNAPEPPSEPPPRPDLQWIVHLGMTGRLLVCSPAAPLPPHTHAVLALSSGQDLRFVDARRFGRLAIHRPAEEAHEFRGPGREPLSIALAEFAQLFRGRKLAIKLALLNQTLLHGVGNIYADESLFRASIRPRRQAGRLTRAELTRLHAALQQVLAHAIQLGGSSVSDYVDADGIRGFFQLQHKVYSRAGQLCHDCATPLKKIIVGGRTTVYCPQCQK